MPKSKKLPPSFYKRTDTLNLCQELLGKMLVTNLWCEAAQKTVKTAGLITELEAYCAPEDKASHAHNYRRTKRTETMYASGGVAYVYLCYGIHHLFNIVTGPVDFPHAILIRAIKPMIGQEYMQMRRNNKKAATKIVAGPGVVTTVLGITTEHDQISLNGKQIYLEDHGITFSNSQIIKTPRIGIAYAAEYVHKPWRFVLDYTK